MTINPRDYDLEELRKMARQDGPPDGPRGGTADGSANGASRGSPDGRESDAASTGSTDDPLGGLGESAGSQRPDLYRELLPFLDDETDKPYLDALPETYAAELVVFEWLEFLTSNAGYHGTVDALDYYASLDWVTDDVRATLSEYLLGIDESETGEGDLDVDQHMMSLVYVAKLTAMN